MSFGEIVILAAIAAALVSAGVIVGYLGDSIKRRYALRAPLRLFTGTSTTGNRFMWVRDENGAVVWMWRVSEGDHYPHTGIKGVEIRSEK